MNQPTASRAILLNTSDNVCVAVQNLPAGVEIALEDRAVRLREDVPMAHKIALERIASGERIIKYGQMIGEATATIEPGQWVHSHNMDQGQATLDYASATEVPPDPTPIADRTFAGYRRPGGRAGTRNYIGVISTVNCSASVAKYVARRFDAAALAQYPHVDGVVAFAHTDGCGIQFDGTKHQMLNRVMGGMARHPNIGGYVVIGLGCEQTEVDHLLDQQRLVQIDGLGEPKRPPTFTIQETGGTVKTVEAAAAAVARLLPRVNDARREPIPASELVLATECGGSDGNSGITSNPTIGLVSDMVVACGGTAILSETTELCGAEHLLTRRARSVEVADKLIERIKWWDWYSKLFGDQVDSNRSIGNKEGGLTTIAEKSLGAVTKGGTSALVDVYQYAEPITAKGLVVMDSPGFDPASITGMVASGANVILFSTGRGSCYGCKPTPSIKIASNTPMYERLADDMDVDAGTILTGRTVQQVAAETFELVLKVASGQSTKSERHGIGEEEFVPWTVGPTF